MPAAQALRALRRRTDLADRGFERCMHFSVALRICVVKKAVVTMAAVFPSRVIDDRIDTKPVERNASPARALSLPPDKAKPVSSPFVLDARLGDDHRPTVARIKLRKDLGRRTVKRMIEADGTAARMPPLIMDVVVETDHVEMV